MAYIEPAPRTRSRAAAAPRPAGNHAIAYTAFTLSVGFAAAVVLGLIH